MLNLDSRPRIGALAAMLLGLASGAGGIARAAVPRWRVPSYRPHQGPQECARRRRQIADGIIRVSGHKARARIEHWSVTRLGGVCRLRGKAYGHPEIPDGTEVVTSAVNLANGTHAETRNTVYTLGQPAA